MSLDLDLEEKYAEYNKKYFSGQLPKIPVRWGRTGKDHAAEFWHDPIQIVIHPTMRRFGLGKYSSILLLHEMVHVKLRNIKCTDHGKKFQDEMKRLADIGAFKPLW